MHRRLEEESDFLPFISVEEEVADKDEHIPDELPVLALKNTVFFPNNVIPITVGRDKSIKAINAAYEDGRKVAVFSQKELEMEEPTEADLYRVGTVAHILKLLKMPDGTLTAILQGRKRIRLEEMITEAPYMVGRVKVLSQIPATDPIEFEALVSSIKDLAQNIIDLSPNIPSEAAVVLRNIKSPDFLLNFIASNMGASLEWKQKVLEIADLQQKAEVILKQLNSELQILELKDQIESKVRGDIEKQQRDYYLNQQLKTIQEELGNNPQQEDLSKLQVRADAKNWPEEIGVIFRKEMDRLQRMNPQVPDYSVQMNYLELMLDLPWNETTEDNFDLKNVRKVLDKDHYGLEKVKARILEHLAVLKLKGDMKAPILCLVGPPGVGKTSLGRSVGEALNREFVRISLGGLHDESEIRGHRR
ncbi:MAG: LON peptidase substrate-binding domain-containing protein, partial [Bacteroidota bacterium]